MTAAQYDKSISTGELQLNGFWEKSTHYGAAFFFMIFPLALLVVFVAGYFEDDPPTFGWWALAFIFVPVALGILVFFLQKRRLKFKIVETNLSRDELKAIIHEVALELQWMGNFTSARAYVAHTNPGFWSGSWGEQITILLSDNHVYVNSICDLQQRSSPVSFGRNQRNEETIIDHIKAAQQNSLKIH